MLRPLALLPLLLLLALPSFSSARPVAERTIAHVEYPGMQKIRYRYGPVLVRPGQNTIKAALTDLKPKRPGFITRFEPNMVRASDNKPPPVDLLHMHHVVWLVGGKPSFAAGEEKTVLQMPRGFGFKVTGKEPWIINDMLHNLIAVPERVYVTWEIDFVPLSSPAGRKMKAVSTQWMDVAGLRAYPVFDALRGWGDNGRYTFPDQAEGEEREKIGKASSWRVDRDLTLVHGAGHLHPGGLYVDLFATRDGVTKRLFRSRAKYFEPAGPVSWDVSMSVPSPAWRVKLRRGDLVHISATYDTSRASWRESMGILPLAVYRGSDAGGIDPFVSSRSLPQRGVLTHGHLSENKNHGGKPTPLTDPRLLPDGPRPSEPLTIKNFEYQFGDFDRPGSEAYPPLVAPGQSLSFVNLDATQQTSNNRSAYHTITSCRAPCTATTGIAYPLEDGEISFDSGQLGFGPEGFTSASNRNTWSTPTDLPEGTYTFFCRLHPSMRGAFRVKS